MKQCVICLQWKDEIEFSWRYKLLGIRYAMCRDCQKGHRCTGYKKRTNQELEWGGVSAREYVYHYLLTHPCTICGESDPNVLEIHHTGGKGWIISNILGGGNDLVAIQAEIATCNVLCTNCHRKTLNDGLNGFRCRK